MFYDLIVSSVEILYSPIAGFRKHHLRHWIHTNGSWHMGFSYRYLMTAPSGYSFREVQNDDRTFWGRVVETAVGAHLWNTRDLATRIHYWRDREEKYEVDYVISRGPHLVGIEVKSGLKKRYQGLDVFKERYTHAKTMIVGPGGFPFNEFFSLSTDEWIEYL